MRYIAPERLASISIVPTLVRLAIVMMLFMASAASAGELDLQPCEIPGVNDARCGSLTVAENPAEPDGRQIDLNIVVLDATGDSPSKDAIFYLAGGPGTAATTAAPLFSSSPLREQRAFVLVDQRGTGGSNPLRCDVGTFAESLQAMFTFDLSPYAAGCAEELSKRADLRFYGTRQIVDDLDAVRRALGLSKINLFGGSYGTRVALQYLRAHGEHARSAILRGVAGPEIHVPLGFAQSSLEALRQVSADCKEQEACAADFPDLEAAVRKVATRLDAEPVKGTVTDPASGEEQTLAVTGAELRGLVHYLLYGTPLAARIPGIVKAAEAGDVEPALQMASGFGGQLLGRFHFGSFLAVICGEDAPFYDEADVAERSQGSVLGGVLARGILKSCGEWPKSAVPDAFKQPVKSDVPVLMISGDSDPVTPASDAESAGRYLPGSAHLLLPDTAHFGIFPGCSGQLVAQFLDSASVEGLDDACVSELERPDFAL